MKSIYSDKVIVDIGGNVDNRYGYNFKNKELFIKSNKKATGILLKSIDKSSLFPGIAAGGVLPRKTFSIGHADEKKFYIECRRISEEQ